MTECRQSSTAFPAAWLAAVALAAFGLGCQPKGRAPLLAEDEPSATAAPSAAVGPFLRFAEIPQLEVVSRLRSGHPIGRLTGVIRVDAAAAGYGRHGRSAFPTGAMVVEGLGPEPDPSAPAALYYVMQKREPGFFSEGGDWEYTVVDASGVVEASGKIQLCARCHAEAPRDFVFEYVSERPVGPGPQ